MNDKKKLDIHNPEEIIEEEENEEEVDWDAVDQSFIPTDNDADENSDLDALLEQITQECDKLI